MKKDFKIDGTILRVDKKVTKNLYLTEVKITDNCNCDDCDFYVNRLIKQPFEIFQMLLEMGIDLEKNLSSEPKGVWCVRDNQGQLIHVDQVYRLSGTIIDKQEIVYSRIEETYKIGARFIPYKVDYVDVELKFDQAVVERD